MSTIWVEFTRHFWAPTLERTLFGWVWRLGWVGVGFSRKNLTAWTLEWHGKLQAALSKAAKPAGQKGQQS